MACPLVRGAHQQLNRMGGVSPSTKPFTPKQGQYLAYIHLYTRLHRRPPAETDIQEYFRVSPPSVHQMVLTLERAGLITRQPRTPRRIEVLGDSKLLTELIVTPDTTRQNHCAEPLVGTQTKAGGRRQGTPPRIPGRAT